MKVNKNKKSFLLLIVLLIMTFSGVFQFLPTYQESKNQESEGNKTPKLSNVITINSPKDGKQYVDPVKGNFPGTYTFGADEDLNGDKNPDDWVEYDAAKVYARIINNYLGHKRVYELKDISNKRNAKVKQYFDSGKVTGKIEFWWCSTDVTPYQYVTLCDSSSRRAIFLCFHEEYLQYFDNSYHNIISAVDNTWYHIRLAFDCTSNSYDIYIDGVLLVDDVLFDNAVNTLDFIQLCTSTTGTLYHSMFFDAFGYDWDPDYDIGDNTADSGDFPATYGFENDDVDEVPTDWSGNYPVQNAHFGHKKVMHCIGGTSTINMFQSEVETGIIEWWWWTTGNDAGSRHQFQFRNASGAHMGFLCVYNGNLHWYRPKTTPGRNIQIYPNFIGQWHHMKVEFDGADVHIYIDQQHIIHTSFDSGRSGIKSIWNYGYADGWESWVDAIGYSWDDGYEEGDNFEEGMLLEFEDDEYTSMSYSLDGGASISILGDTVIPKLSNGYHYIEVSGIKNDIEYSGRTQFFIGDFVINSLIEGELYSAPMDRYFPATYGFENDENGAVPMDWSGGVVQSTHDEHNKIMHLESNGPVTQAYNNFYLQDGIQTTGSIEFWWYATNDAPSGTYDQFSLRKGGAGTAYQLLLTVEHRDLYWKNQSGPGHTLLYENFIDEWHHLKIDFDETSIDVLVDDDLKITTVYNSGKPGIGTIFLHEENGKESWYDAFGYTWKNGYTEGDNLEEGLLLDFEPDNFDTMKYRLNGNDVNIIGDTVIPFPETGDYTIQVFGNGETFQSEIRTFSVKNQILIGSTERVFPQEGYPSKLGYTVETIETPSVTPKIVFKITDTVTSRTSSIGIRLYIDNQKIDPYMIEDVGFRTKFEFEATPLASLGTHQIFIELSMGTGYKLDNIMITNLNYVESLLNGSKRYLPIQVYQYGEAYDYAHVIFNTRAYTDNESLGFGNEFIKFGSSMEIIIDPDMGDEGSGIYNQYYIHYFEVQWKLLDPLGEIVNPSIINEDDSSQIKVSNNEDVGNEFNEEIAYSFDQVGFFISIGAMVIPGPIGTALDVFGLILPFTGLVPPNEGPIADQGPTQDNSAYYISWRTGLMGNTGAYPRPSGASMYYPWGLDMNGLLKGNYQAEITWKVDIYNWASDPPSSWREFAFTISDTYYTNFNYY